MPKVAVIMACYNAMPYLPEAVGSVLNQSYRDFQLVVVNDGSTDDSGQYLEQCRESDSRIVVIHQPNQGQNAAANNGIQISDSKYIARMDSDDLTDLDRLEKQVSFMEAHPDVGLSGGQLRRLGTKKSGLVSNLPLDHHSIVEGLLKNHHTMCNGTCIYRRDLFKQIGGYWEHNISEDWDLFLRMSEVSRLANLSDCFLSYRLHTHSVNGRRIIEAQLYNEYAAHLYRLRAAGKPTVPYQEFLTGHRSNRWPSSWQFYLDSQSIGQYREAIAEIYSGQKLKGYARLGMSMMMSPGRTLRRVVNIFSKSNSANSTAN